MPVRLSALAVAARYRRSLHTATCDSASLSGMTPLLAASVTGHTEIVEYVIDKLGTATRREVIDALELLGATHVDKGRNMHVAYELWRKAMAMR